VRAAAAQALGLLGASRSLPHLLAALHDSSDQVAQAATDALITLDSSLLEIILLHQFNATSPADREIAALGLARLGSDAALERLVAALDEPDPGLRLTAAHALGHADTPALVDPLIRALEDPELTVQREAILALAKSGDPRAEPHLLQRLEDPDHQIRHTADRWFRLNREPQSANPSQTH
jgi:HEAT repeat protein